MRYRKKPLTVNAVQWTGSNVAEMTAFAGHHFTALSRQDRLNCDDSEATASVLDDLHSTWILLYTDDWIIKGIQGEFYPCRNDVFQKTYEPDPEDTSC